MKNSILHQTATIIFRRKTSRTDRLLIGECCSPRNPCCGKWIPGGGHINENETPLNAAIREGREEMGLIANPKALRHLGTLEVNMVGRNIFIWLIECTDWSGRLKRFPTEDFKSMEFLGVNEMPWKKMPRGDEEVIMNIFCDLFARTKIICGKTRDEVISIESHKHPIQ